MRKNALLWIGLGIAAYFLLTTKRKKPEGIVSEDIPPKEFEPGPTLPGQSLPGETLPETSKDYVVRDAGASLPTATYTGSPVLPVTKSTEVLPLGKCTQLGNC